MDIKYNTKCYKFKEIIFKSGLFDETVDCTYIIHLKGNNRLEHIYSELEKVKPTKKVIIVFNEGFKKCNKKLIDNAPYQDLSDAFLQCFNHANENNYGNILILEDDFIFNKDIRKKYNIENINNFLNSHEDEEFIYSLGAVPIFIYPLFKDETYKSIKSLTMHSVIYSKKLIRNMNYLDLSYKHWDVIIEKYTNNRYLYSIPLCYQTFPETDNKKTWSEKDGNKIIFYIKDFVIKLLNLDKECEPGFAILYIFSKLMLVIIILAILLIFYWLIPKTITKKKNK